MVISFSHILVISILHSFSLVLVDENSKRVSLVLVEENSKRFSLLLVDEKLHFSQLLVKMFSLFKPIQLGKYRFLTL